ncbi:hypothetical protein IF2G_07612 [Cordyceps javanica]|nr:hypothetical protein IF2G_07612 [Cordyceps javanica]
MRVLRSPPPHGKPQSWKRTRVVLIIQDAVRNVLAWPCSKLYFISQTQSSGITEEIGQMQKAVNLWAHMLSFNHSPSGITNRALSGGILGQLLRLSNVRIIGWRGTMPRRWPHQRTCGLLCKYLETT